MGSRPEVGSSLKSNSGSSATARAKANSLAHASAEFGWLEVLEACEPHQFEFHLHDQIHDVGIDVAVFDQRQRNVFADGERLKQGTKLEIHPEAQPKLIEFALPTSWSSPRRRF